jgi:hypothetical protein
LMKAINMVCIIKFLNLIGEMWVKSFGYFLYIHFYREVWDYQEKCLILIKHYICQWGIYCCTKLHGVLSQKTIDLKFIDLRTSNISKIIKHTFNLY